AHAPVEVAERAACFLLDVGGRGARSVEVALALVSGHFALEFGLHWIPLLARAPRPQAGESRSLGQALGAEHHQGHEAEQQQLAKAEVEHGEPPAAPRSALDGVVVALGLALALAGLVAELAG